MAKTSTQTFSKRKPPAEPAPYGGCPACRQLAGDAADYFRHAFDPRESSDLAAEALAEAFGYCSRHGALLLAHPEFADAVARIFPLAAQRALPWLDATHLHDEAVQRVFFPAADACPACRFDDLRFARQSGHAAREFVATQPEALCLDHFHAAAARLHPEQRLPVLARYLGGLEDAAGHLARSRADADALLELVAGRQPFASFLITPEHEFDLASGPAAMHTCPVCIDEALAHRRWIDNVRSAAAFGLEGWPFFPTCPAHVREIAALGNAETTRAVVGHALDHAGWRLRKEIETLTRLLAREDVALRDWNPRRRRKSGEPKPPKPTRRAMACPGCERRRIARDQSVARLLERVEDGRRRYAEDEADGLCMKHFAAVCLLAPRGEVRTRLMARQRDRLLRLATDAQADWQGAVHLFAGFSGPFHVGAASALS